MKPVSKRVLAALSVAAVSVVGLSSAQAATGDVPVRPSDFSNVSTETTIAGDATVDFLKEGIHISVPDANNDYAIGVFSTNVALADVDTITYDWFGTDSRPGVKLDVDVDGNGAWDCQFQSEQAYGSDMMYLNKDTQNATENSALADNYCADHAPTTTGDPANATVAAWTAALKSASGKDPQVVKAGYGASGLEQDGVLRSISLGDTTYVFTDEAATDPGTPTDVSGSFARTANSKNLLQLTFTSNDLASGQTQGNKLTWQVKVGDTGGSLTGRLNLQQGAGETSVFTQRFVPGQPKQTVQILKNGAVVGTYSVTPTK